MLFNLSIKYYLILGLLFLSIYARTVFPLAGQVTNGILIFGLFIFIFILLIELNINNLLSFQIKRSNKLLQFLFIVAIISFCYSYIHNIKYNLDIFSIAKTLSYFVVTFSFLFILAKKMFNDENFFEFILTFLLVFGIISSFLSFVMLIIGYHPIPAYSVTTTGFFAHPNTTSFLYTIVTPILIYKYFSKKISFEIFIFILILFIICLLFTYSRAGYMGVFLGILVFTYNKSKKIFISTVIILLIVILSFVIEFAMAKSGSSIGRALLIITAINMIVADQSSFLWGYGVYNFVDVFQSEKLFYGSVENVVDPHNLILLLGIQFGMLFTILIILIIAIVIIKNFWKLHKINQLKKKNRINLCLAVTMGLLMQNMLEDLIFYPEYFVMPIFLMFLGYLYYNLVPSTIYAKD